MSIYCVCIAAKLYITFGKDIKLFVKTMAMYLIFVVICMKVFTHLYFIYTSFTLSYIDRKMVHLEERAISGYLQITAVQKQEEGCFP